MIQRAIHLLTQDEPKRLFPLCASALMEARTFAPLYWIGIPSSGTFIELASHHHNCIFLFTTVNYGNIAVFKRVTASLSACEKYGWVPEEVYTDITLNGRQLSINRPV